MKTYHLILTVFALCVVSVSAAAQAPVVINDPTIELAKAELTETETALMDKYILPKVREKLASESCEESIAISGREQGAFTKAGADQTLVFYQFCWTGNGIASVGIALIENGRVIGNYISPDNGQSEGARVLPDINENGLDEIELYYSGGMHQGAGGTGVDIMEFTRSGLKGIGWYQAEGYTETSPVMGYRVTVAPGKTPTFSSEKYVQNAAGKWRKTGKPLPLKLKPVNGQFEQVK